MSSNNRAKRCTVCSAVSPDDDSIKQCPECDGSSFVPFDLGEKDIPHTYAVVVEREIDSLPGQPGYEKYTKWQDGVLAATIKFKPFFEEVSTSVAKYEDNGVSMTFGAMRIQWIFPFTHALDAVELVRFVLLGPNDALFDGCDVEHYLTDREESDEF
ncbi:MAG: hypothetical protein ACPGMW_03800 [Poseidonia sp.]